MVMALAGLALLALVLVGIGAVLAIIGFIFFMVMLLRLGEVEGISPTLKNAGVMLLVGFILSFIPVINIIGAIITLIAVVMIYRGAGESIHNLTT
jgi:hypothetical protein